MSKIVENNIKLYKTFHKLKNENEFFIKDMVELSYLLRNNREIDIINEYIKNYSDNSAITWTVFIQYCVNEYIETNHLDLEEFIEHDVKNCADNFISEFYRKNIDSFDELSKDELLDVIESYDTYITEYYEYHSEGTPVCVAEYYNNEYQEKKEMV